MISEEMIEDLIRCQKKILKADRRKMISKNRSSRNNATLSSLDGKYKYRMFLRRSDEFFEDFSVGLIWTNPNEFTSIKKDIILLRCQGPHDSKQPESFDLHHSFHIHQISVQDIEAHRYSTPRHKEVTDAFHSFEEAAWYFSDLCGIINIEEHFEYPFVPLDRNQLSLF